MQNRYVADIGDFGKIGLLRKLQETGCSIGVNWYITPDENHNTDGCFTDYLKHDSFRNYDSILYEALKKIVDNKKRNVQEIQNAGILNAVYYSEELSFKGRTKTERAVIRDIWHKAALKALSNIDIVFLDPDNGIITSSTTESPKSNKYVLTEELINYYNQGSSIVYYQHKARKRDEFYINQHLMLISNSHLKNAGGLLLKFQKTSHRYYGFIIQPKHEKLINEAVEKMLETSWNDFFCLK